MLKPRRLAPAAPVAPASAGQDGVEDGQVRCGIIRAYPAVLDALGADWVRLVSEVGLDRTFFDDQDNTLSYLQASRLLRLGVEATGVRHLGILVGAPVTLSAMGAVGFLMRSSPTVGHALKILADHFHVHDRGGQVTIEFDGHVAMLGYRVKVSQIEAANQVYMVAAASARNFLWELCGPGWQPIEVQLPFRRPEAVAPIRKVLAAPLSFDSDRLSVLFPAKDLERPIATADPVLYRMMSERVSQLESKLDQDIVGRVRDLLQTLIFLRESDGHIVANRLGTSLRTLKRRLQDRGTTLQGLRDEVRCAAACHLLEYTGKTASEVAVILGYADASAFTRAFRRWVGMAPSEWRARSVSARPRKNASGLRIA